MATRRIHSRAPTRIDLAGGTLDIWPLYLFLKNALTINLAIDLHAEATVEIFPVSTSSQEPGFRLFSEDQKVEFSAPWTTFEIEDEAASIPAGLLLHHKLLNYFFTKRVRSGRADFGFDLHLTTRAKSPAGAGLGGSSTLSIAMIGALATWASEQPGKNGESGFTIPQPEKEGENYIDIVRDVETTVIKVPAGLQDYYGAMYGGLQKLKWGAGTHERSAFSGSIIQEIEDRILLFYSGQSRNSGINNWTLFKKFIDNEDQVRQKFERIARATHHLNIALKNKNWDDIGQAIAEEWVIRKTLASGITTPEIDLAFAEAEKQGSFTGKVCGAGGGGCFFVYLPETDSEKRTHLKSALQQKLAERGVRALPFRGAPQGLNIQVEIAGD